MARPARLTVIADTGAIYALIDASDAWHHRVSAWWKTNRASVILPAPILPEVAYLLQTRIGARAEEAFIKAIVDDEFNVDTADDYGRIAEVMTAYGDLPLGFVDASVVVMAEAMGTRTILTTDRRHFGVVRPKSGRSFALVP